MLYLSPYVIFKAGQEKCLSIADVIPPPQKKKEGRKFCTCGMQTRNALSIYVFYNNKQEKKAPSIVYILVKYNNEQSYD